MQARKLLIFYFLRRHGIEKAEDLAHDTLAAVWSREDYQFEKEEDFFKVCFGFARNILQEGYRDYYKHAVSELNGNIMAPVPELRGLCGIEVPIFLDEVSRQAAQELADEELRLIQAAVKNTAHHHPSSGKIRTKLHRARKKLAKVTGWRKEV